MDLTSQYEKKIRPCIDLIDSLRALGVEKDLGLPAIAVIGDQSSGKSSVLEALSGVTLPRGSGIVTRCPLELKLKKSRDSTEWSGKMSFLDKLVILESSSDVGNQVKLAQDLMAGTNCGVSEDLITLEITSPDVPDLTLIDLPGITRVALPNQPSDTSDKIKKMIQKYIKRQETICLAVIPSNVDLATTEALEMAREVDPTGERTLGILTKPDLVDKGSEVEVLHVVQNEVYKLEKGYMMVKCRGQQEIQNNLSLQDALNNERAFFEEHEYFRVLLEDGYATIPCLAEKLTNELVAHIIKTLPSLEKHIKDKLKVAEQKLKIIGTGVPESQMEKFSFLYNKISTFTALIFRAAQGEEDVINGSEKLFNEVRTQFCGWKTFLENEVDKFLKTSKADITEYENKYRGRELPGFVSYRVFEQIVKEKIQVSEEPAMEKLKAIQRIVQSAFSKIAEEQFLVFTNLHKIAKSKIENIGEEQEQEAEKSITTQFKMEDVIYCQDSLYVGSLKEAREAAAAAAAAVPIAVSFYPQTVPSSKDVQQISLEELSYHVKAYLKETSKRLSNQIPLIIQYYILQGLAERIENDMMFLLQDKERMDELLEEKPELTRQRKGLKDQIKRLNAAHQCLYEFKY
ncbi:interferon-induced GTP-binding protein Mx2-like [Discoglossus pictus]